MAERLTVDQDVVGSTPISHPHKEDHSQEWFFLLIDQAKDDIIRMVADAFQVS